MTQKILILNVFHKNVLLKLHCQCLHNGYSLDWLQSLKHFYHNTRALTRILKIGVKMAPSRNSWSFTIRLYWDFSKSWSQIQKVGVNYSKFGVNETSDYTSFLSMCPSASLYTISVASLILMALFLISSANNKYCYLRGKWKSIDI